MKLIMPLIFALIGAVIGVLICKLFVRSWLAYPAAAVIGALSAFAGILVRDIMDTTFISSNALIDTLFAALAMSLLVSILANIATSIISQRERSDKALTDERE